MSHSIRYSLAIYPLKNRLLTDNCWLLICADPIDSKIFCSHPVAGAELAPRTSATFCLRDDHATHAIGGTTVKAVNPTPEIDKLAKDGMVFEKSFCSNSICGPSRAVIMSGKHSHKNGFMNNGNTFNWNQQIFPSCSRKRAIKRPFTARAI